MASTRSCAEPFGMYTTAFLPKLLGGPCDAAPVVAVGGSGESHLLFDGGFQGLKREGVNIEMVFFSHNSWAMA